MLLMITLYRLPEFMMGPMTNPFYHDLGFSKDAVGAVRGVHRPAGSPLAGIAAGGLASLPVRRMFRDAGRRLDPAGRWRSPPSPCWRIYRADLRPVRRRDGAATTSASAFAGVALVTYMSSLTSLGYTATQYALLSSTYAWVGKFLKGFSGADRRAAAQAAGP